jgi:hypothetical protein
MTKAHGSDMDSLVVAFEAAVAALRERADQAEQADEEELARAITAFETGLMAAGQRAQADAVTIARLEKHLEHAYARAYQAEQDRHHAEAHADRAEQRSDGADLAWEAENKRADEAEQARDLLRAAFDQSRQETQMQLDQARSDVQMAKARVAALERAEAERAARSRWRRLRDVLRR